MQPSWQTWAWDDPLFFPKFDLIASFLDDLANPFGGSWSCDPAKEELTRLAEAIDRDLVGACVKEEI